MKLNICFWGLVLLFVHPTIIVAQNSSTGPITHDIFHVSTGTPPGLMWLEDTQQHRSGVNPSYQLDKYGILRDEKGELFEITNSITEQQNEDDPDANQPRPVTPWSVSINNAQGQTYTIHIKGITYGVQNINISDHKAAKGIQPYSKKKVVMLITPNSLKQITVIVSDQYTFSTTRVVEKGDLLDDVKSACHQDFIDSKVCKRLEKKTEAIQDALEKRHKEETGKLVRSFLCNLGALKGDGDDDRDDHDSIKEPALNILIADAKALLQTLPNNDHH